MNQKQKRRKAARLTCGQMILLFLVVVVFALGAALAFGYSLGVFDRFIPQLPSPRDPTLTMEVRVDTAIPNTQIPANQDLVNTMDPPSTPGSPMPVATQTQATVPTPTLTSTTPPTAPPDVCAQIDLRLLNATSNIAAWRVGNASDQPFTLNRIEIGWPGSNDAIFNAFLDGNVIWSGQDLVSPTIITSWFGEREDRTIVSLSRLEFFFGTDAAQSGYDLTLRFENGCEVSASN